MKEGILLSRKSDYTPRQTYCIGDVYLMRFDGTGSEQTGWRPGVVFQNNVGNKYSPNLIALPFTTALKKTNQPTHVVISASEAGLLKDSMVLCENPERISKDRIGKFITTLSDEIMRDVAYGFIIATSAISFLEDHELIELRQKTLQLNSAGII